MLKELKIKRLKKQEWIVCPQSIFSEMSKIVKRAIKHSVYISIYLNVKDGYVDIAIGSNCECFNAFRCSSLEETSQTLKEASQYLTEEIKRSKENK